MDVRRTFCFRVVVILGALLFAPAAYSLTVTNTNDSGPGSLRNAIAATPTGGTIDFALTGCPCTILLTSGHLFITKELSIIGPGSDQLRVSANSSSRVFVIEGPTPTPLMNVVIQGLTVANGRSSQFSGGIDGFQANITVANCVVSSNNSTSLGGGVGIYFGRLTILNSVVLGNFAQDGGGGIYNIGSQLEMRDSVVAGNATGSSGGGLFSHFGANSQITRTTFAGNTALTANSAYIFEYSFASLSDSTFVGSTSGVPGSEVDILTASAAITNCTFSFGSVQFVNRDLQFGDPPYAAQLSITSSTITGDGDDGFTTQSESALYPATVTIRNSIIAGNGAAQPDVINVSSSATIISQGYNLIGNAGNVAVFNGPGDQAGSPAAPIDPRLEPLAMNGGPTRTHAPRLNSPVVDKGKAFGAIADQRGLPRPNDNPDISNAVDGDGSDIGAFEVQFPVAGTISVSGRVLYEGGVPAMKGMVTLTDSNFNVRYATVNPFGYYRFEGIPVGRAYTVGLLAKRWTMSSQVIFAAEPLTELNLTAR